MTASPFPSRARKFLVAAIAASALVACSVVGTSVPAQAASGVSTIRACFQSSFKLNGTTYWGKYTGFAYVDYWYNGKWNTAGSVGLSLSTGCGSVTVTPGYQWRMHVNQYLQPSRYVGNSAYFTVVTVSGSSYDLGTARLSSVWVG